MINVETKIGKDVKRKRAYEIKKKKKRRKGFALYMFLFSFKTNSFLKGEVGLQIHKDGGAKSKKNHSMPRRVEKAEKIEKAKEKTSLLTVKSTSKGASALALRILGDLSFARVETENGAKDESKNQKGKKGSRQRKSKKKNSSR